MSAWKAENVVDCSDQTAVLVERELRVLQLQLRARNWYNRVGLYILDKIVDDCVDEVLLGDHQDWGEPLEETWEFTWAAATTLSVAAENAKALLDPYANDYVGTCRWYFRPLAQIERIFCERAILSIFRQVDLMYSDLKSGRFQRD